MIDKIKASLQEWKASYRDDIKAQRDMPARVADAHLFELETCLNWAQELEKKLKEEINNKVSLSPTDVGWIDFVIKREFHGEENDTKRME